MNEFKAMRDTLWNQVRIMFENSIFPIHNIDTVLISPVNTGASFVYKPVYNQINCCVMDYALLITKKDYLNESI